MFIIYIKWLTILYPQKKKNVYYLHKVVNNFI